VLPRGGDGSLPLTFLSTTRPSGRLVASSAGRTTARPLAAPLPRRTPRVHRPRRRRLVAFVLVLVLVAAGVAAYAHRRGPAVSPLRARIVALAQGQVGYGTDPSDTYCNKFSAYWNAGVHDCGGNGNLDEEWCADFAAWAWKEAGAVVAYQLSPGYLNGNSASFYVWGIHHDTWHPIDSGYTPQPGDVAVYGLDTTVVTAVHVAVVTASTGNDAAPDVVNGDGDRTGFSVVELGDHQAFADVKGKGAPLSGYVSPLSPPSGTASS
jgi:CHAP domain